MRKPFTTPGISKYILLCLSIALMTACSEDAMDKELNDPLDANEVPVEDDKGDAPSDGEDKDSVDNDEPNPCQNAADYVFREKDGLLNIEFEDASFSGEWKLKSDGNAFSGEGYMVWEGDQHLGKPGNGKTSFSLRIEDPGTYQFLWKSAVKTGDSGSDHNDTWLRFGDADDFYGQKENSIVFPRDIGKSPNPEGASKEGWFKIYRSGNDLDFKWQAKTFDNNAHDIFVVFEKAGLYTMEVSARSSGHAIDKFVLFKDKDQKDVIAETTGLSEIRCD
ncbi:MAG: hypothetical protein WBG48_02405 [Pricia sp.]